MSIRTTIFAAAAVAVSAFGANAATFELEEGINYNTATLGSGALDLNIFNPVELGTEPGTDYTLDRAFNLRSFRALIIDPLITDSGSLTVSTFVDPFSLYGIGAAQVLITVPLFDEDFENIPPEGSLTVQWGDGDVQDIPILGGGSIALSTLFEGVGEANAQDLVFTWNGFVDGGQLSANVAAIPLPAGILLLGTALGGLGLARRRRKS